MESKVIEIARFDHITKAEMLTSLLQSEGIECYVRDGITSQILLGNVDIGGAKVELLDKDAKRAAEIMKKHGYKISERLSDIIKEVSLEDARIEYEKSSKAKLSRSMTLIIILLLVVVLAMILLNKFYYT